MVAKAKDIHTRNLELLVQEIFKTVHKLNPPTMWNTFNFKGPNKYDLRRGSSIVVPKAQSAREINSFDPRAALAWNHLPATLKTSKDIKEFSWQLMNQKIYCRCKMYIL